MSHKNLIVELDHGVYLASGVGDPSRTLLKDNAKRFCSYAKATSGLLKARRYRDFISARIIECDAEVVKDERERCISKVNALDGKLPARGRSTYQEGYGDAIDDAESAILSSSAQRDRAIDAVEKLRDALLTIVAWGPFPKTGDTWSNGAEMSCGSKYGSNGERDYMRNLARETLAATKPDLYPRFETRSGITTDVGK